MSNKGGRSVAVDSVMVEDAWHFEDDIVMDCNLTSSTLNAKLLGQKNKVKFLHEKYKDKPGLFHSWSREQTNCLWQKLDSGDYNLSRIQRMNPVLKVITLTELHDRAIVLLMFRRCLVLDPVSFFHSDKPHEHQYMLKTWLVMTKNYQEHYYAYHGHNGNSQHVPDAVKKGFKHRIMKGLRILNEYGNFYFEGIGGFRYVLNDIVFIDMEKTIM